MQCKPIHTAIRSIVHHRILTPIFLHRYVKYQWFRSYATSAAVARVPATAPAPVPVLKGTTAHVTQKLMSDGSQHRFDALDS